MLGLAGRIAFLGGLAAFSPADITPFMWHDAQQELESDGAPAVTLNDLSGNGHDIATADGDGPTFRTSGINSLPSYEYDGVDDASGLILAPIDQPTIIVLVFEADSLAADMTITGGTNQSLTIESDGAITMDAGTPQTSASGVITAATPAMVVATFDGASSSLRVNGADVAIGNPGTGDYEDPWIGAGHATSQPFNGFLGEHLVFTGPLAPGAISQLEAYLTTRWGL